MKIMKNKILSTALICTSMAIGFVSCKKDEVVVVAPTVIKEWTVNLSAKNENPAPATRSETGNVKLQLLSDNSLNYNLSVTGLAAGDVLNAAHIHVGNVISNGGVIVGLDPVFTGSTATGNVKNLRSTFVDSLKNDMNELYFNVHSVQMPGGLLRGQLNIGIDFVADVMLMGANEVPAVTTNAMGVALLRVTTDKKLYSKITVSNLDAGDILRFAHIHKGATGVNGPVIIDLAMTEADFGVNKVSTLSDVNYTSLKSEAVYVNAHSVLRGGGLVRGQIR